MQSTNIPLFIKENGINPSGNIKQKIQHDGIRLQPLPPAG